MYNYFKEKTQNDTNKKLTNPARVRINGNRPVRSRIEAYLVGRTPAKGTKRVLRSVNRIVSLKPGKSANTSLTPFFSPLR